MADEPPRRVDSDTPEGRLWNWLAGEWERTHEANARQARRLAEIREAARHVRTVDDSAGVRSLLRVIDPDWEFGGAADD